MDALRWRCLLCGSWYDVHAPTCSSCLDCGTIVRVGWREQAAIDLSPEITNAAELMKASWTPVSSSAYPDLRVGRGALAVVYGPAGGGKSSFTTRLLNGLAGPVVLQSVEEAPGPSLHERLRRCRVSRADFVITGRASVDQLAQLIQSRHAIALAIDSVQMAAFSAEELRHLLLVLPTLRVLVAIAQVNKAGRIEGRERLIHEADVAVRCEGLRWQLTKSRYQLTELTGDVLDFEGDDHEAA